MADNARVHVRIEGKVQGVYFRSWAVDRAQELQLTGWVRNAEDGAVEITAEGEKAQLEKLISMMKMGPPAARVKEVKAVWQPFKNEFKHFEIKYEWL